METNENSVGPIIATVIILVVIILGGLYFWGERNTNSGAYGETSINGMR
jgi:hypothetical protein